MSLRKSDANQLDQGADSTRMARVPLREFVSDQQQRAAMH